MPLYKVSELLSGDNFGNPVERLFYWNCIKRLLWKFYRESLRMQQNCILNQFWSDILGGGQVLRGGGDGLDGRFPHPILPNIGLPVSQIWLLFWSGIWTQQLYRCCPQVLYYCFVQTRRVTGNFLDMDICTPPPPRLKLMQNFFFLLGYQYPVS